MFFLQRSQVAQQLNHRDSSRAELIPDSGTDSVFRYLQATEGQAARRDLIKGLGRKVSDESIPLYVRKTSNTSQDNLDSRKNSLGKPSDCESIGTNGCS